MPGIAAIRGNGRRIRDIFGVVTAGRHLAPCGQMQQVRSLIVLPRAALPKVGQRVQDEFGIGFGELFIPQTSCRQVAW